VADEVERSERDVDGQKFFDYVVSAPDVQYDAAITTARGKVYAIFVRTPAKDLRADPSLPGKIVQSFRTLKVCDGC